LGSLSEARTRYAQLRNYPENTAVTVDYVFEDLHPKISSVEPEVTDSRFGTLTLQHTFLPLPENDYQPRFDDPRVGFFNTQVTDLTSTDRAPYRDLLHRWHLEPKVPEAEISEPVTPITWWMENTTPVELRETIRDAGLAWNLAFRKAGWEKAVDIRQQPDDAPWDAGDVRYHVLRWTSSPSPRFGGYGPSFANPLTGQILGADIMLEWVFLSNRVHYQDIFVPRSAGSDPHVCALGLCLHQGALLGRTAARLTGLATEEEQRLLREGLSYLVLHEIGHTLGLAHNFRATHLRSQETVNDRQLTSEKGLASSVMDYPALNLPPLNQPAGEYYQTVPGPYDIWAIQYGYSRKLDDGQKRQAHLALSHTDPALAFANDADDMRSPGKAVDPRAMIGDMTSDPVGYAESRLALLRTLLRRLASTSLDTGKSYQQQKDRFDTILWHYENQLEVLSRFLGGLYVDRSFATEDAPRTPYTPVPAELQHRALAALQTYLFDPDALPLPPDLLRQLQPQRRGWDFEAKGEDPKILTQMESLQKAVLDHLLHPHTLTRILNTQLYGNEFPLGDYLPALTHSLFQLGEDHNPNLREQQAQRLYVDYLLSHAGLTEKPASVPHPAQVLALYELERLISTGIGTGLQPESHPHHRFLIQRIQRHLEDSP
ncbi:MAG: zinc-dependent metalloprotease, partial [Verrucomicrobiota bacterium]